MFRIVPVGDKTLKDMDGAAPENVDGNVMDDSADLKTLPEEATGAAETATPLQIIVPSAYLVYSPLTLLPRSMIAPVGTPPDCDTVPRILPVV